LNLVAQPLHLIERRGFVTLLPCAALSRLALPHSLLRLAELLAQFVQSLRNLRFSSIRIGIDAAAQPVRRSLHMVVQIGVIHTGQRIAQLLRNPGLIGSHLAFRIADAFLQLRQLVGELLPLLRKLVALADQLSHIVHVRGTGLPLLAGQLVDLVGLRMLLLRQLTRLAREVVDFVRRKLLLCSGKQVGGIAQTVCGLLRGTCALLRRATAFHRIRCLLQTAQRLLNPLISSLA